MSILQRLIMPESSQILLNWGEYIPPNPERKIPGYSIYLIVGVIVVVLGFYTIKTYSRAAQTIRTENVNYTRCQSVRLTIKTPEIG